MPLVLVYWAGAIYFYFYFLFLFFFQQLTQSHMDLFQGSFLFLLYGKEWLGHSAKFFCFRSKKKYPSIKVILYFIEESHMGLEQMNN